MKLIAAAFLLLSFSLQASAQTAPAQPVGIHAAGVDHVGITVPDLKQAQAFLASTFGCTPVTYIGPST